MSDLALSVVPWTRADVWAEQDARTAQRHRLLAFFALLVFFAASAGISVAGYCWPIRFWFEPAGRTLVGNHIVDQGCVPLPE